MDSVDLPEITFMSNHDNYYYNFMPFRIKNVGATYHRLTDAIFSKQIGRNLEVYIDDMIVKTPEGKKPHCKSGGHAEVS